MPKINSGVIIVVVLIVIALGVYFYSTGALPTVNEQETQEEQDILSIAGKVTSTNTAENSFVVVQQKEEREFVVKLGDDTEFIRLVFPFDINNPPADATFSPEREIVTIEDLEVDDQVFVRSFETIKTGEDIMNPLEVQILP